MSAIKNPLVLPNQADIQSILHTPDLVLFYKFHENWVMDFINKSLFFGQ